MHIRFQKPKQGLMWREEPAADIVTQINTSQVSVSINIVVWCLLPNPGVSKSGPRGPQSSQVLHLTRYNQHLHRGIPLSEIVFFWLDRKPGPILPPKDRIWTPLV